MSQFTEQWAKEATARARAGWGRGTPAPDRQAPDGHVSPVLRKDPYRNKWERDYAQQLALRQHIGEVVSWRYEAIAFRLGPRTTLNPDFLVITTKGFEIHEVKGRRREKWWARFKIAVEMFPWFRWFVCERSRGGDWTLKEVGRHG